MLPKGQNVNIQCVTSFLQKSIFESHPVCIFSRSMVIHVPHRSWPICTSRSIRAQRNSPVTLISTFSHWFIIPSPHHNFIDQLFYPIFAPASETHPIVLNVIYYTICFEGAVNNSMATSIVLYAIRWLVLIEVGWMWFGWIFAFLWDWDEAAVGHWALSEKKNKKTAIVNSSGSLNEHFLSHCDQLRGKHMWSKSLRIRSWLYTAWMFVQHFIHLKNEHAKSA